MNLPKINLPFSKQRANGRRYTAEAAMIGTNNFHGSRKNALSNFFRFLFYAFILILLLSGYGCADTNAGNKKTNGQFSAAVWNIQAFFDGTENGNEYAEYRVASGWTQEKYAARLLATAQAISKMKPAASEISAEDKTEGPDLIGLVELENAAVLEDLLKGPLSNQGYIQTFFGSVPGMVLGIGVISRYPLTETKVHSITINNETTPRPVLEIHLEPAGKPLVFFLCHWKSKVGGEETTESLRQASARVIRRRITELKNEEPGAPVIIMGDLNENHDEFYRRGGVVPNALMPDDPKAASLIQNGSTDNYFLILSKEKPPRSEYFPGKQTVLYSPWENELKNGSYYFRDNWETIDHFLLSEELFDGRDWDFETCMVLNTQPFINAKGIPNAYYTNTGLGLSDHLPLLLYLQIRDENF